MSDFEGNDAIEPKDATEEPQPTERRSPSTTTEAQRIGFVLNQISEKHFTAEWLSSLDRCPVNTDDSEGDCSDMHTVIEKVVEYRNIMWNKETEENVPNMEPKNTESGSDQWALLINMVLGSTVNEDQRQRLLAVMGDINDQQLAETVAECLNESQVVSDVVNTNSSEEESIRNSKPESNEEEVANESKNEENSNSMISPSDIKAKESFAQLSKNDLESDFINKNQLMEENQKLIVENEKYKKLVDRMNKSEVSISDNSGAIDDVIALKNQNQCLQNEIIKLKEIQDSCLMEMAVLREKLHHSKSYNEPVVWNREAITGFCDREYLYKLILSQLLNDGHQNLAVNLANNVKSKLVPPSERLHHLVAIALKAEGDSPLSDDSIAPMNLIDLDFDADRNSGSSRASLYDTGNRDYMRGHSYSPESDAVAMPQRMMDIGRIIASRSQTSVADPMPSLTHVQSNDSIASRSTPDISIPPFGQSISNGLPALSPNAVDMSGHSSAMGGSQQLDLNDYITQLNLAQLMYINSNDPATTSVASSANTPSPTPITPSVPLENGGLVLNEAALKNISQLAKMSATDNGLIPTNSTSPTTIASNQSRSASAAGSKPNVMQIRCKFGQLGQQKGQFSSPHGFCLGVDEEIVIADTNNHRICIFDKSADFKHSFGVPGKDEAQLWYPRKVAIIRTGTGGVNAAPRYVICDRGAERSRMQIFTRSGHFVRKIAIRYIDIVAGLAITPNGHIVAVDSVSPTVFVIAETGDLLRWFDCSEYMREPSDIAINNHEYYICDFKGHCVVVFNDEGQYMRKIGCEGLTSFPNGIDISDAGDILVGDSHGNRFHVVVFDRSGTLISEFECPYVKVSRCCGLKITSEGYVVTLAKNNHHVLILNTLYIM